MTNIFNPYGNSFSPWQKAKFLFHVVKNKKFVCGCLMVNNKLTHQQLTNNQKFIEAINTSSTLLLFVHY